MSAYSNPAFKVAYLVLQISHQLHKRQEVWESRKKVGERYHESAFLLLDKIPRDLTIIK